MSKTVELTVMFTITINDDCDPDNLHIQDNNIIFVVDSETKISYPINSCCTTNYLELD